MLRQLQLRAPIKGMQLKRSLTYNSSQLQPFALVEVVKKEQHPKMRCKTGRSLTYQVMDNNNHYNNLPMGYSKVGMEITIYDKLQHIRQYSVCPNLNPLELLHADQNKMTRSNNLPKRYSDNTNGVALVALEQPQLEQQTMKNVGTPKSQPQPKIPEQPGRKIPYYNPLRRRSNVDPARVQYIKDRFKERNMDTDTNKPQGKKFVSRTTLHSGRLDKID